MARKAEEPTAAPATATEPVQETEPKSAWDEEVEMVVPRKSKGDDQQYYVCVNDRRYTVPANGRTQKLPRPIAEILQQSIEAEIEAEEYADKLANTIG